MFTSKIRGHPQRPLTWVEASPGSFFPSGQLRQSGQARQLDESEWQVNGLFVAILYFISILDWHESPNRVSSLTEGSHISTGYFAPVINNKWGQIRTEIEMESQFANVSRIRMADGVPTAAGTLGPARPPRSPPAWPHFRRRDSGVWRGRRPFGTSRKRKESCFVVVADEEWRTQNVQQVES